MSTVEKSRTFLLEWNNRYPLDYGYRKKYGIAFGSPQHREINQIDVYYDWLEDRIHNEVKEEALSIIERERQFARGIWIREPEVAVEDEEALFSKLNVADIDNSSIQLVE